MVALYAKSLRRFAVSKQSATPRNSGIKYVVTIPHRTDIYVTVDTVDVLEQGDCSEIRLVDPFPCHVQGEGVVHEHTICESHFGVDGVC